MPTPVSPPLQAAKRSDSLRSHLTFDRIPSFFAVSARKGEQVLEAEPSKDDNKLTPRENVRRSMKPILPATGVTL